MRTSMPRWRREHPWSDRSDERVCWLSSRCASRRIVITGTTTCSHKRVGAGNGDVYNPTDTLNLTPGTRRGVYEVAEKIGEGGMGQVYRAIDTTLGRQVAIKILPAAFAADAERVARFEREAKTLASLNHPHIAAIYG